MKILPYLISICLFSGFFSCKKFLDKSPNAGLTVPTTISDFNNLLNQYNIVYNNPAIGELGSDDYYLSYANYLSKGETPRNCYTWQPDIFDGSTSYDWDQTYGQVYYANVVLSGLGNVSVNASNQIAFNQVKGRALFMRAIAFFNLSQLFAKPYMPSTAGADLGIPLRLSPDLNVKMARSTIQQTYDQIILDLKASLDLVPLMVSVKSPNIPSKPAVFGLLSRVYLNMQDYERAFAYADSSLQRYSTIVDYNSIDTTKTLSFSYPTNPEVLYQAYQTIYFFFTSSSTPVDTLLYKSYQATDLRKSVFFATSPSKGTKYFRGTYTGNYYLFCGLATDEIYLIRAECEARLGNITAGLNDLNTLLRKRYMSGSFTPVSTSNPDSALRIILEERRKELVFREIRWSDLRRLNQDPRFAKTLTRVLNGQVYTLPPNDPRYVYPIADDEMKLSGLVQNPR